MGPSVIVACGDYKGGCLKYFPKDDGKSSLELIDDKASVVVDINCKPFYFDGTKAHAAEPFEGNRYSFVFYCAKKGTRSSDDLFAQLSELGFNPPHELKAHLCDVAVGVTLSDSTQEETDTVECHAGETLPTIDEIWQHCQYS